MIFFTTKEAAGAECKLLPFFCGKIFAKGLTNVLFRDTICI